ncbi:MAG: D-2-hydroxyacid dehydrogenase [Clostridiales bacterium]|nr:D-2-hydroxyacid dehydrogenase [Clostridiales bacterium]
MNILVTPPVLEKHRAMIEAACPGGSFRYIPQKELTKEDVRDAEVIIGNIPHALVPCCEKLRLLHLGSAGADGYPAIMPEGAYLTNSSGAYGLAISEHMLGMTLAIIKKLYRYWDNQRACLWRDEGGVTSMEDAVVLVVGMGDIGGDYARKCSALGAYVIGIRRRLREKPDYVDEMHTLNELDELLPRADIVAMALPSGQETNGLMDERRLRLMKEGAVLVNVGRGKAISTDGLVKVCGEGRIRAALDVTDPEPLPPEHPLWRTENVYITPHISGFFHLPQTLDRIIKIGSENLRRLVNGEELLNRVDGETGYRVEENRA